MKRIGVVSFKYETKEFNGRLKANESYKSDRWFRISDSMVNEFNKRRFKQFEEIEKYSDEKDISHLLFPGFTLFIKEMNFKKSAFENDIKQICNIFKKRSLIFEICLEDEDGELLSSPVNTGIVTIEKGEEKGLRIQQLFAQSSDYKKRKINFYRLWEEIKWGHRVRVLDDVKFLIWICGEINFLESTKKGC